jgi:hypothetical protein
VRSAKRVHQSVFGRRSREACHYLSCDQKHVDKIETGINNKLDKTNEWVRTCRSSVVDALHVGEDPFIRDVLWRTQTIFRRDQLPFASQNEGHQACGLG